MKNKKVLTNYSRGYDFSQCEFEIIQKLVYQYAGISLPPSRKAMVYNRLARRLRVHGHKSFNEYLCFLEGSIDSEREAFINALTTNLTAFFREEYHFPILEKHILQTKTPWEKKKYITSSTDPYESQRNNKHKIHLWCSAASTGEEAYSMAITMIKAFNTLTPPVHILATDLDTNVITHAQQGIYPMSQLEKLPKDILKEFFLKGNGCNAGSARVRQELRDMITFRPLNLLDEKWPIRGPFAAIFCRNVMIYFDKTTQYNILTKFAPLLSNCGLLFTGHSESFQHAEDLFKLREKKVYELANRQKV